MIFQKFHITILCLWVSVQLILGSIGLPIIEHYCQMSGKTSVSFLEEKKCCCAISAANFSKLLDPTEETNFLATEKDCCDTEISYEKADFEAISLEKQSFDFDNFIALLPSSFHFKNLSEKPFFTAFQIIHFADLPPPKWKVGKLYIVFIQVFRL